MASSRPRIALFTALIAAFVLVTAVVVSIVVTATTPLNAVEPAAGQVAQVAMSNASTPAPEQNADHPPGCNFAINVGKHIDQVDRSQFGKRPLRVIRPGDAVTMDYSEHRINLNLDARDIVASVTCG